MYIGTFIRDVNKAKIGGGVHDPTGYWSSQSQRPFVNSMIKLGYIERIEYDKVKKLKNIPTDMSFKKAKELTKGMKLPAKKNYSTWGKLKNYINERDCGHFLIIFKEIGSKGYSFDVTISGYIGYLKNLEYIEVIEKGFDSYNKNWYKIKKLKDIPDELTVSLAQKKLYDDVYKRCAKIAKIKENLNNI